MGSLFTIYKHLGDIVKCIFMILLQIQQENNFLPTSKHPQAKVRRFLGICLYDCFIYRSNFVFRKCLETRRHLGSGRKTVNSQGYSELWEPSKRQKLLFTDLVNTTILYNTKVTMKISPLLDKSRSFIMTSTTTCLSVGFLNGIITEEFPPSSE